MKLFKIMEGAGRAPLTEEVGFEELINFSDQLSEGQVERLKEEVRNIGRAVKMILISNPELYRDYFREKLREANLYGQYTGTKYEIEYGVEHW